MPKPAIAARKDRSGRASTMEAGRVDSADATRAPGVGIAGRLGQPCGADGAAPSDGSAAADGADAAPPPQRSRDDRVRVAAYLIAERRGFAPGCDRQDWLEAERQIDAE